MTRWRPWRDRDAEVDAEIESHLRMAARDRIERGESPAEARRRAVLEFGSVRAAREDARAVWRWVRVEHCLQDLRSGLRILTHSPGLSVTAIALIALVIGGNTTIYSAVHGMLTKPAPGIRADGLVSIAWTADGEPMRPDTSYPVYRALVDQAQSFEAIAFRAEQFTLLDRRGVFSVRGASVSPNYFEALGLALPLGRVFAPGESRLNASGLVAIVSDRLWREHLGGGEVLGREVALNGHPATIVGVAPPAFQGAWLAEATDVWVPYLAYARVHGRDRELDDFDALAVHGLVGRLRPGASLSDARTELAAIAERLHASRPAGTVRRLGTVLPYAGNAGRDNLIAERGPRFLALFSVVTALTLVIVCANVANLMLARAVARQREMAVRQSFGASRLRVVRLVIAEGLVLSLAAWVGACLFAYWMSQLLPHLIPPSEFGNVEVLLDFSPDWRVLGYAMLLALAATLVFTAAPAVRTWRQDLLSFLKAGEQHVVHGRSRVSQTLVVLQLAFSVLLLACAGLALRSVAIIDGTALGFDTRPLLLVTVDTAGSVRTTDGNAALLDRMIGRLRGLPGVRSASFTQHASGLWPDAPARRLASDEPVAAEHNTVSAGYFATVGVRALAGGDLPDTRAPGGAAPAIVNARFAAALWPDAPAIGREFLYGSPARRLVVAGVVPDVLYGGFRRQGLRPMVFTSMHDRAPAPGAMTLMIRHAASLEAIVPAITQALREVDPGVPVVHVRTLDRDLESTTWLIRTLTTMLVAFAGTALCIAALGQYAAMAFAMRRRVRDFGIRMAMGASTRHIFASVLAEGLTLTGIGLLIGVALGLVSARAAQSLLYGVTPTDPAAHGGIVLVLAAASLAACYLPARRAAGVNPMEALRQE